MGDTQGDVQVQYLRFQISLDFPLKFPRMQGDNAREIAAGIAVPLANAAANDEINA
jgi:hypothetical protein